MILDHVEYRVIDTGGDTINTPLIIGLYDHVSQLRVRTNLTCNLIHPEFR